MVARGPKRVAKDESAATRGGGWLPRMDSLASYDMSDTLNIASHELRAPITPLKMRLQQTRRRLQHEGGRERDVVELSLALYHVERMQQQIALYLDAASLMGGVFTLITGMSNFTESARRITSIYASGEPGRAIRLEEAGGPLTGVWDTPRLDTALRELLGNALKFSCGDITLRLARRGRFARVEVENAGPAIPAGWRRRIFEPYVTGDQHNHGLGLGLYVAREIARRHGGELGLRSGPATGVRFWLTLPLSD